MHLKQISIVLLSFFLVLNMSAQYLNPMTRFHAEDNPYCSYSDEFLSGFVQSADGLAENGFLQMPFIGDPLLVYVGEKDSTQYMAYASGYDFKQRSDKTGRYFVDLTRYGIKARLSAYPAYTLQEYVYPDTLADKGLLIDLDYAMKGYAKENMEVKLVDKYTLRASKRSSTDSHAPQIFYYAQFSHPFMTWNIRRERVKLENGDKEARCKVALTFSLKPDEKLVVASAVSKISSDQAFTQLEGHEPKRYKETNASTSSRIIYRFDQSSSTPNYIPKQKVKQHAMNLSCQVASSQLISSENSDDFIDLVTKDAELRAAFYSALSLLKQQPECSTITSADQFLTAIVPFYIRADEPQADEFRTDTLLREYAKSLFAGNQLLQNQVYQAAWYIFNALGFRPSDKSNEFEMVRPLFNAATLHLSNGRRFLMYMKNNSPKNVFVERMAVMHKPVEGKHQFTYSQLLRGGTMEVKMSRTK